MTPEEADAHAVALMAYLSRAAGAWVKVNLPEGTTREQSLSIAAKAFQRCADVMRLAAERATQKEPPCPS